MAIGSRQWECIGESLTEFQSGLVVVQNQIVSEVIAMLSLTYEDYCEQLKQLP